MRHLRYLLFGLVMTLSFSVLYGQDCTIKENIVYSKETPVFKLKSKEGYPLQIEVFNEHDSRVMVLDSSGTTTNDVYWYVYFPEIQKSAMYVIPLTKVELFNKLIAADILDKKSNIDKKAVGSYFSSKLGPNTEVAVMDVAYQEPKDIALNIQRKKQIDEDYAKLEKAKAEGRAVTTSFFKFRVVNDHYEEVEIWVEDGLAEKGGVIHKFYPNGRSDFQVKCTNCPKSKEVCLLKNGRKISCKQATPNGLIRVNEEGTLLY